jgi:hypothetical protein
MEHSETNKIKYGSNGDDTAIEYGHDKRTLTEWDEEIAHEEVRNLERRETRNKMDLIAKEEDEVLNESLLKLMDIEKETGITIDLKTEETRKDKNRIRYEGEPEASTSKAGALITEVTVKFPMVQLSRYVEKPSLLQSKS